MAEMTLLEWYRSYIQTLFSTVIAQITATVGYLTRSQFKPFYMISKAAHGFTSNPISFFINNFITAVQMMMLAMGDPEPDFQTVIELAQHLGDSARSVGALRTADLTVFLKVFAEIVHKEGCLIYLEMLLTEINALDFCFKNIFELETAIVILGLAIPFDW